MNPVHRIAPRLGVLLAGLSLASLALALLCAPRAGAAVEVPFTARYAADLHGGLAMAANTLMTCPASGPDELACLESREGKAPSSTSALLNNNHYAMERVDVDGEPATFDSSSADLTLPAGATVEFAALYYGARTSGKTGALAGPAAPEPAARGAVELKAPGAAAYTPLAATVYDSGAIAAAYVGSVDVTSIVAAAGSGTYTVANVQAGGGEDRYGGWSLVVAYSDPAAPPRSIRVFDGLASIEANQEPVPIDIAGLETPAGGTVNASVGLVGYEGDRGSSGDSVTLAGKKLTDAANPENNVFNSSIAAFGANVTTKSPNYVNQLGFDSNLFDAGGYLGNGVTATTIEESTNIEQYLTQAVAVAIELDPAVLEPEPPAPPTAETQTETPPANPAPPEEKPKPKGHPDEGSLKPTVGLDVAGSSGVVRPTEVVTFKIEVTAGAGGALHDAVVCNQIPGSLRRLRAKGAKTSGGSACWHVAKLPAGRSRSFTTTARVDADARGPLKVRTTGTAANSPSRGIVTRLRAVPLPNLPCGAARAASASAVAHASC